MAKFVTFKFDSNKFSCAVTIGSKKPFVLLEGYLFRQRVKQSEHVKLLGVQTDNKLYFDVYVKDLCKK